MNDIINKDELNGDNMIGDFDLDSPDGIKQLVGASKALRFVSGMTSVMEIKIMASVKNNKKYKIAGYPNWESFCRAMGVKRRTIDGKIKDLNELGESAYMAMLDLGIKEKDLRLLKSSDQVAITASDDNNVINFGDERIALNAENKDRIIKKVNQIKFEKQAVEVELKKETGVKEELDIKNKKLQEELLKLRHPAGTIPEMVLNFKKECGALQSQILGLLGGLEAIHKKAAQSNQQDMIDIAKVTVIWIDAIVQDRRERLLEGDTSFPVNFLEKSFIGVGDED